MPAGLMVVNDNGIVQLDQDTFNLQFSQKLEFNYGSESSYYTLVEDISFEGTEMATVAYRVTHDGKLDNGFRAGGIMYYKRSGSTWTYTFAIGRSGANVKLEVWVFDRSVNQAEKVGLAVFNANGQQVFHSSGRPLNLRPYSGFEAGKKFAIVQQGVGIQVVPNADHQTSMKLCFAWGFKGTDTVHNTALNVGTSYSVQSPPFVNPRVMLADVTGYP